MAGKSIRVHPQIIELEIDVSSESSEVEHLLDALPLKLAVAFSGMDMSDIGLVVDVEMRYVVNDLIAILNILGESIKMCAPEKAVVCHIQYARTISTFVHTGVKREYFSIPLFPKIIIDHVRSDRLHGGGLPGGGMPPGSSIPFRRTADLIEDMISHKAEHPNSPTILISDGHYNVDAIAQYPENLIILKVGYDPVN